MIYFTSDLHIGHDKPFIYSERGFSNIKDHDEAIIKNINDTVCEEDTLYILGDLCMTNGWDDALDYIRELLSGIKCKDVKVVLGNHDTNVKTNMYKELGFEILGISTLVSIKKHPYILSHYPTLTGNGKYKGVLHGEVVNLYGHTHQKEDFLTVNDEEIPLSFHVGVDSNDLRPISITEIREKVHEKYNEVLNGAELRKDLDI